MFICTEFIGDEILNTTDDITLINNTFEINNDDTIFNMRELFEIGNQFYWRFILPFKYGWETLDDSFYADYKNDEKVSLISFEKLTKFKMINNQFYGIPNDLLQLNVPFLLVNNDNTNCMSNNIIHDYGILLESGSILSCEYVGNIPTNDDSCWNQEIISVATSLFIQTIPDTQSIVLNNENSYLMVHNATFNLDLRTDINISSDSNITLEPVFNPILIQAGSATLLFTSFGDNETLLLNPDACKLNCLSVWTPTPLIIEESQFNCIDNNISNTTNVTAKSQEITSIGNELNIVNYVSFLDLSTLDGSKEFEYFPAMLLPFDINILNFYGDINTEWNEPFQIQFQSISLSLDFTASIHYNSDGNQICSICESNQGLYISSVSTSMTDMHYAIDLIPSNKLLQPQSINITIISCPQGWGKFEKNNICTQCDTTQFKLYSGNNPCQSCTGLDRFIDCPGNDIVTVSIDKWVNIRNPYNLTYKSEYNDIFGSDYIIMSDCPQGICCQNPDGCNYLTDNLCAPNRDPNIPLCGKCLDGYSEVFASNACEICKRSYYERLIYPLIYSAIFALYLVYNSGDTKIRSDDDTNEDNIETEDEKLYNMVKIMLLQPIAYFFQAIVYIMQTGGFGLIFLPLLQLFNFEFAIVGSNTDDGGYCFIKNMTSITKILLNIIIPVFILVFIFLYSIIPGCKNREIKVIFVKYKRRPQYGAAYFSCMLLGISVIEGTLLKLLACRNIGIKNVRFYAGNTQCFDSLWFISLLLFIGIIALFTYIWYKMYKMKPENRFNINNSISKFTKGYNHNVWFWEFLVLIRYVTIYTFILISI